MRPIRPRTASIHGRQPQPLQQHTQQQLGKLPSQLPFRPRPSSSSGRRCPPRSPARKDTAATTLCQSAVENDVLAAEADADVRGCRLQAAAKKYLTVIKSSPSSARTLWAARCNFAVVCALGGAWSQCRDLHSTLLSSADVPREVTLSVLHNNFVCDALQRISSQDELWSYYVSHASAERVEATRTAARDAAQRRTASVAHFRLANVAPRTRLEVGDQQGSNENVQPHRQPTRPYSAGAPRGGMTRLASQQRMRQSIPPTPTSHESSVSSDFVPLLRGSQLGCARWGTLRQRLVLGVPRAPPSRRALFELVHCRSWDAGDSKVLQCGEVVGEFVVFSSDDALSSATPSSSCWVAALDAVATIGDTDFLKIVETVMAVVVSVARYLKRLGGDVRLHIDSDGILVHRTEHGGIDDVRVIMAPNRNDLAPLDAAPGRWADVADVVVVLASARSPDGTAPEWLMSVARRLRDDPHWDLAAARDLVASVASGEWALDTTSLLLEAGVEGSTLLVPPPSGADVSASAVVEASYHNSNNNTLFESYLVQFTRGRQPIETTVRRQHLLSDVLSLFAHLTPDDLPRPLKLHVENESAIDLGGVTSDVVSTFLADFVASPRFFSEAEGGCVPVPGDSEAFAFEHLGKVLMKCVVDKRCVGLPCHPLVLRAMVHGVDTPEQRQRYHPTSAWQWLRELRRADPVVAASLGRLLSLSDEECRALDASTLVSSRTGESVQDVALTTTALHAYIADECQHRLLGKCVHHLRALHRGFHGAGLDAIWIPHMTDVVEALVGRGTVSSPLSADAIISQLEFRDWHSDDSTPYFLCCALRRLDAKELALFLRLTTSLPAMPSRGLAKRISVFKAAEGSPVFAHTCFLQLDLPAFDSLDDLDGALRAALTAVRVCPEMHDDTVDED
eukprot:PhM_4_TR3206/c0_g1_i1/m.49367